MKEEFNLSEKILQHGEEWEDIDVENVKEFIKLIKKGKENLKGRNKSQRAFIPCWRNLSREKLVDKLYESLDSFDKDIDEMLDINKLAGEKLVKLK